jgi:virulence-associated protein VagC
MLTRVFKSGNSIAVRIPSELAFIEAATDVEIERVGNTLVLRPISNKTLADLPLRIQPGFHGTGPGISRAARTRLAAGRCC